MNAYPLSWPDGWPRTPGSKIKHGKFTKQVRSSTSNYPRKEWLSVSDGLGRVLDELARMGIDRQDVIVSTNVRTRLDGLPRSGEREPDDSGAAVYWEEAQGARRVVAIDIYSTVADNLAAIAATLDALRAVERHGGARILERAFTGFTAIPAPAAVRTWWEVLGVARTAHLNEIKAAFRRLCSVHHPDKGGSHDAMAELNAAYNMAISDRG